MKRYKKLFLLLTSIPALAFVQPTAAAVQEDTTAGYDVAAPTEEQEEIDAAGNYLKYVLNIINSNYVGSDVDLHDLVKGAISGITEKLDKYSEFMDEEKARKFVDNFSGEFSGIGIEFSKTETGYPVIAKVYENSEAEKAGIQAGDKIIAIDNTDVKIKTADEIAEMIKQHTPEQKALIKIERNGKYIDMSLSIGENIIPSVFVKKVEDVINIKPDKFSEQVRYVQITTFDAHTGEEFSKAVNEMKKQNVTGIIIDLRMNGGGLIDAALSVCADLIPEGTIMTLNSKTECEVYSSEKGEKSFDNIIVLVDGQTASSSELMAAGLQDAGAVVVGSQTYGKGVMQAVISLPEMGALKITTAEFFSRNGRKINGVGITPNVPVQTYEYLDGTENLSSQKLISNLEAIGYKDLKTTEDIIKAISEFQKVNNIEVTGCINTETAAYINGGIQIVISKDDKVLKQGYEEMLKKLKYL